MPLKMKELPEAERPYEKLKMYGEGSLSNAELLAIVIKTGTKEENSLEIANRILLLTKNLYELKNISIEELTKIKGIGEVKAMQIKAICELARRLSRSNNRMQICISSSKDVANILMEELQDEEQEHLKLLILNTKNEVIKNLTIAKGDTNTIGITVKQILSEPIKMQAPKIILAHNHPSGDPTPSYEDEKLTRKVMDAAELFGIKLLDHLVIGRNKYQSILSSTNFKINSQLNKY